MNNITTLDKVMHNFVEVLEMDTWCAYVNYRCPDPEMHELAGFCPDCQNFAVEGEGMENRMDICKLSQTCKALRIIVEQHNS